jgi:hypothetical protein
MPTLEESLAAFEAGVAEAQKSADALTRSLRGLRKAAASGHLLDLAKALDSLEERARQAETAASGLPSAWRFDAKTYLEHDYLNELKREADAQGLNLVERDGRFYCFPLVLRIEPPQSSVRIGSKRERRLRPKEVVRRLAAMQKRRQRFNEQRFLDMLYQVYQRVQGPEWTKAKSGPGPIVTLIEIYEVLTLLPGSDYPIEEFGRDLLLLARQPDLRTRDGCSFDFPGSTLSKERIKRINVYDEHGKEETYIGLRFTRGM